jgi:pyruvate,water dikinase
LAVVVQEMVESEASGVLFTANPVSGLRTETVIDATLGLGEALVSGQVEPDHYVVDTARRSITSKTLGAKSVAIRGEASGGVVAVHEDAKGRQALPDDRILALAELGQRVAAEYDFPQDIEWAWANGRLCLLQSRPITSLFPLPEGVGPEPLRVVFSFGAVQGMLDPITPLGRDAIRLIFAGAARMLGYRLTHETQGVIRIAGERLWVDATAVIRNSVGRRLAQKGLSIIEPSVAQALDALWDDPRLQPKKSGLKLRTIRRIARFALPMLWRVLRNWQNPDGRRAQIQERAERGIVAFRKKCVVAGDATSKLIKRAALFRELLYAFPTMGLQFISSIIAAMVPFSLLNRLSSHLLKA